MRKHRLTWKRQPNEKGLARVCQGERGWILSVDGKAVCRVAVAYKGWSKDKLGYYWYGSSESLGIAHRNTCNSPVPTAEEAKAECERYVRECLESHNTELERNR
jgi:hypothetical protein